MQSSLSFDEATAYMKFNLFLSKAEPEREKLATL